jgi:hypothetical protein
MKTRRTTPFFRIWNENGPMTRFVFAVRKFDIFAKAFLGTCAILKVHPFVKIGMTQKKKHLFRHDQSLNNNVTRQSTGIFGVKKRRVVQTLGFLIAFLGLMVFSGNALAQVTDKPSTEPLFNNNNGSDVGPPEPAGSTVQNGSTVVSPDINTAQPSSTTATSQQTWTDCLLHPTQSCEKLAGYGGPTASGAVKAAGGIAADVAKDTLNWVLLQIITFLGLVVNAAAALLSWTINPELLYNLMQNSLIYEWWKMIRDILNILFIGVLLLSAFSTIFQIDRYHYSKVLKSLILMALLVNFSFPIARFVIDFANRLMYFIFSLSQVADAGANGIDFGDVFLRKTGIIETLVTPAQKTEATSVLFAGLIMLFLFAMALLTIAVLMLVRVVALMLIVIFSPVGFVGQVVPGMGGLASKWWNNLFRYAFFGPVAALMLSLSMAMMSGLTLNSQGLSSAIAKGVEGGGTSSYLTKIAQNFALEMIPLVMIYMTIGLGTRMSIKFADKAEKFGKWGAGIAVAAPFWKSMQEGWIDRRKAAKQDAKEREWGRKIGTKGARGLDHITSRAPIPFTQQRRGDAADRLKADKNKARNDRDKKNEDTQRSHADLVNDMKSGGAVIAEAAALTLAKKKDFSGDDLKIALEYIKDDRIKQKVISAAPEQAFNDAQTFWKAAKIAENEPQVMKDLIGKANSKTFGDENFSVEAYKEFVATDASIRTGLDKLFERQMKNNQGAHILIAAEDDSKRQEKYSELVRGMSTTQLANQNKIFYGISDEKDSDTVKKAAEQNKVLVDVAVELKDPSRDQLVQIMRKATDEGNANGQSYWSTRINNRNKDEDDKKVAKEEKPKIATSSGGKTPQQVRAEQNKRDQEAKTAKQQQTNAPNPNIPSA